MPVSNVKLFDNGLLQLLDGATATTWEATGAGLMHGLLIDQTRAPVRTDTAWSAHSANEVSGTGYTAGGIALEAAAVNTQTGSPNHYRFTSSTWHSSTASGTTITAKYFLIAQRAAGSALIVSTDVPIFWVDLDTTSGSSTVQSNNGAFQVGPHTTNGWFRIPYQSQT